MPGVHSYFPLVPILLLAAALRLSGLNWDAGAHLHPDERFITMVVAKVSLPTSVAEYFDTARSPLNPYNNGFDGFAYGMLPLFLGRLVGEIVGLTGYDDSLLLGRSLSALADVGTVAFVYLLALRLYGRGAAIIAGSLMALSVLNIQLSHFYAFDTFATFFVAWTLYFGYRAWSLGRRMDLVLFGIGAGFAAACKISAVLLLLVVLLVCLVPWPGRRLTFEQARFALGIALGATILGFRIAEPYAFSGWGPTDVFRPNPQYVTDKLNWIKISSGDVEVPYMIQWANTNRPPLAFVLDSLVRWGLGPLAGLASLIGLVVAAVRLRRWGSDARHLLLVVWAGLNLLYFGTQFAKFMRYLLPAYPALVILAGYVLSRCWAGDWLHGYRIPALVAALRPARTIPVLVLTATGLWALAFVQIYSAPTTRQVASHWLIQNVPNGSVLAVEHWDDALPLGLPGKERKAFRSVSMDLYDDENPDKRRKLLGNLDQADYLILSSNRLYGSIPRLPERYPLATAYYRALFDGKLGYEVVAEFVSRPRLLGFEIVDDGAQEDFTVYDHPKVTIFSRQPGSEQQRAVVLNAVSLDNVARIPSREGSGRQVPLLTPGEWSAAQTGGTWSSLFDADGLATRFSLPLWWAASAVVGLAAWPLCWRLLPNLADRGFGLARVIGLLLLTYASWLLASLKVHEFDRGLLLLALCGLVGASVLAVRGQVAAFLASARANWRLLASSEAAFTVGFVVCLWMRLANPDLWHGSFGGEKPMDFAYLNAVVKSEFFPPYDPWFAAGAINYYYFGFVFVAALIKVTGVIPSTAYNLALALWFGFTCQAAFTVASSLAVRRVQGRSGIRAAVLAGGFGTILLALVGNLDGALQFRDALWKAGALTFESAIPGLAGLARVGAGLLTVVNGGRVADFDFWRSTRVIGPEDPGPITEFPFFTFLYGDLHAHLLALPLTIVALALALEMMRSQDARRLMVWQESSPRSLLRQCRRFVLVLSLAGLTLGAVRVTNTWDFPTYTIVLVAALICLFRPHSITQLRATVVLVVVSAGLLHVASSVLFAPFLDRYVLYYSGVELSRATTSIGHFLTVNGLWVFAIASVAVLELARWSASQRAIVPGVASTRGFYGLAIPAPVAWSLDNGWRSVAVGVALAGLALAALGLSTLALIFILGSASVGVMLVRWRSSEWVFACCLALVALAVLALPDILTVKGDIGRMNTVFKFYLQAWTILALLSGVWLSRVATQALGGSHQSWRVPWLIVLGLLLAAVSIYPVLGAPARLAARFGERPITLDGMDFMQSARYRDRNRDVNMDGDYQALRWLQKHVSGSPVVMEANTGLYKWGSRVSIYTGLPTVIGWDWHQKQQRVGQTAAVEERLRDVRTIYESTRLEEALRLLEKYGVQYVYVGGLEQAYYPAAGLQKFDQASDDVLEPVYRHDGVTIYRLRGTQ